ncbi:MAG: LTA synthase family protein [Bacteroidales bacterium]|nr:LTA synthase family protein [Bacteroidales bacterium]
MPAKRNSKKPSPTRYDNYFRPALQLLTVALLLVWLSRLMFYLFNLQYFSHLDAGEVMRILALGLRFDLATLFMLNAPFIFMMTLPLPVRKYKLWRFGAMALFLIANIIGLMANIVDIVYFRFTFKRMTADIFSYTANDISLLTLLPQFFKDFWAYFLLFFLFVVILIIAVLRFKIRPLKRKFYPSLYYSLQVFGFLAAMAAMIIGIRGGLQLKPINIITAGKVSEARNAAFVLNTPFTIIKTLHQQSLSHADYFDEITLEEIYTPIIQPAPTEALSKGDSPVNLVVIIMESLSAEHVGAFNKHHAGYDGFTPFLDSLMQHAVAFRGFANGKQSIEAIPAILASIPSLLDKPYINSAYAANKFNSLADLLGARGYQTAFYHGGTNGTMDFDGFAQMAGFDKYYGRTEYNNETDFDGQWGIFDEPFFGYFADGLDEMKPPFFATIFSLSAHHPYTIPEKYSNKFPQGNLKIQQTVAYADFALRRFFAKAAHMPWYGNTLFVITADHTSEAWLPEYKTKTGMYEIPIVFYAPGFELPKPATTVADQIDIMPSALGLLGYDKPFVAFGQNIFDNADGMAVNYLNGVYQLITDSLVLEFDSSKSRSLYNYQRDRLLQQNLLSTNLREAHRMEQTLKAVVQQYNNRMIDNQLTIKP